MLPSSPQVKTVYNEGIIPTLKKLSPDLLRGTLCIDSTTLDVVVARDVAERVIATGANMVDAPVSGGRHLIQAFFLAELTQSRSPGVAGAKAGKLSFLVGGTQLAFERSHPFLSFMGQRIIHCGPSGSGLAAKICNNVCAAGFTL